MSKYTIMVWDLINPINEYLGGFQPKRFTLADAGTQVRKALGDNTPALPARPGQLPPFVTVRIEIDFKPLGTMTLDDEEMIVNDPLLHQRIIDAVQSPFRIAAQKIAGEIKSWNADVAPAPTLHVQNIKNFILQGQREADTKIKPLMEQFKREKEGASSYRWSMAINLTVGTLSVAAAVITIALSSGVAAAIVIPGAAVGGARGGLDLLKSFRDVLISARALERRLEGGMKYVREEAKKGPMALKAVLAGTIKLPSMGYTWCGSVKWASVADLKNDCDLYEKKLMEIRDTVHSLAREVPKLMDQIKAEEGAAQKMRDFKWRGENFKDNSQKLKLERTKREQKLHELLEKIIEFEKGWRSSKYHKGVGGVWDLLSPKHHPTQCVWDWQSRLDGIKGFQNLLNQALAAKDIAHYEVWEKNLDLCVNGFFAGYNLGAGVATFNVAPETFKDVLGDVVTVVGSVCDAYSIRGQVVSNASAKFEV